LNEQVRREARDLKRLRSVARERGAPAWWTSPRAPAWVRDNRPALALLDRKRHNRHQFAENLHLAVTRISMP